MGFCFQRDGGSHPLTFVVVRPVRSLEVRSEEKSVTDFVARRLYQKAPLFDRFVKFNVQVEASDTRH